MAANTSLSSNTERVGKRLDKSLDRFLSRKKWRIGMLTSNLRLDSSHFRYACRVAIAALLAMSVSAIWSHLGILTRVAPGLSAHSYWIVLTVLVVMKRSEEHTSELQSLMRISYAVFCLKKKKTQHITNN